MGILQIKHSVGSLKAKKVNFLEKMDIQYFVGEKPSRHVFTLKDARAESQLKVI